MIIWLSECLAYQRTMVGDLWYCGEGGAASSSLTRQECGLRQEYSTHRESIPIADSIPAIHIIDSKYKIHAPTARAEQWQFASSCNTTQ